MAPPDNTGILQHICQLGWTEEVLRVDGRLRGLSAGSSIQRPCIRVQNPFACLRAAYGLIGALRADLTECRKIMVEPDGIEPLT